MPHTSLVDTLAGLASPLAASLGLELWGIELVFGGRNVVRIFVEAESGVSIDQCAELSRLLGLTLDVEDIIPGAYVLEVSSPGLERKFFTGEQLARFVGQRVEITLHQAQTAWPGRKKFRGLLQKAPPPLSSPGKDGEEQGHDDGSAPRPAPLSAGERADLFLMKAEELARPGEEEPCIAFCFADLKKAVQLHSFPERILPGKSSGKKSSEKKTGNIAEKRKFAGAHESASTAGQGNGPGDDC